MLWFAFDHGSLAGRRFGSMGMVDYFRLPKRQWYWYRNEYRHIPPPAWPSNGVPAALKLATDKTVLRSVDGTDDAQIVVQVMDKDGRALNNCPPVTLAIESGPGEFPTGPSITFAPGSDIPIRDGMAAIEFRSYYAGKTQIRATSPGLKDATIAITSLGDPKFVAGQTPMVKVRPYVRFTGNGANGTPITFRENPTRASSETSGHSGRLANDADATTFWQATAGDTNAWWQADLERVVELTQARLIFPVEGAWRYKIETSEGGSEWKLAVDQTNGTAITQDRTVTIPPGMIARFVRITFAGLPPDTSAALAEAQFTGHQPGK